MPISFNEIDDDSMLRVFSFLSFKTRVILERVCRRWKNVLMKSYSDIRILSLYKTASILINMSDEFVTTFFKRLSIHLIELHLDIPNRYIKENILYTIADNCPNLNILSLNRVSVSLDPFQTFLSKLTCLESLSLSSVKAIDITDRGIEELISHLTHLTHLTVRDQMHLTGQFIRSLPTTLTHLSIGPNCLVDNALHTLTNVCLRVTSLNLEDCELYLDDFKYLCERSSSVTYLNISNVVFKIASNSATSINLPFVGLLRKLEELHASNTNINDDALKVISLNCPNLHRLCFKSDPLITDAGIIHLCKLRNLKVLDFNNNSNVNDWSITHLVSSSVFLQKLYLCNCKNLRGAFLCFALSCCPQLEFISLCKCNNINDNVVNQCALYLTENSARKLLTVNVHKTQITVANVFANDNLQCLSLSFDFSDCDDHHDCCLYLDVYDYFN